VTNNVSYSGINVVTNLDETGVFQTVGAGAHYLANNSSHRNAGTTAINPILLNDLRNRTTFPPVVIPSGDYSNSAALWPQAQRDTDIPDLGYHYDPLDYAFGSVVLWNAQLDVKPGTALATFGQTYGLVLRNGAKFFADGSPTNLVRIARYNTVQEQCGTNWSGYRAPSISFTWWEESSPPEARFRFTQWSTPAQDTHHFYGYEGNPAAVAFSDCQFHGGAIHNVRPVFNVTNSLFERLNMTIHEGLDALGSTFLNNTFIGGALALYQDSGVWTFKDNLFDQTAISIEAGVFTNDYNVYVVITNDTRISTNAPHDIVLTNSPAYELGTLGRYYFPTNDGLLSQLINSGSQTAADAGLYHHTTTSDQVKEGNSTVDRGFHYVELNNGVPFDSDSDGLADYLEDKNGSGTAEGAETNWNDSDTDDDGVPDELEIRQGRNPLIQNTVADTNGIINLRVYTPLK